MSLRGSLALMPRTRRGFVLFLTAVLMLTLAFQYVAAAAPSGVLAVGQSVDICHRTDSNSNPYVAISPDIDSAGHLKGGHDTEHEGPIWNPSLKAQHIEWGDIIPPYTYQPADGPLFVYPGQNWPEGQALLEDGCNPKLSMNVVKGVSLSADGPFDASLTTTVGTTVHYRITITNTGNIGLTGVTLSDNKFDLEAKGCTVPTTLAAGAHYTCNYTSTAVEGTTTNVATGDSAETDSDSDTATVIANPPPAPALTVDKGVSTSASGPFEASLTTTTGTTVHYRITVTNTGNVTLHGVTLSDNKFDLVAKGCTIPTTLAVGAHFDCDYTDTAATGTKTNIATGDSTETDSDTGTATVTAAPTPAPALTVDKGVSLSADGTFAASLTTTTGTTVHYRITITNTGNVTLHGVTLTDNTFNLADKGCTIPTELAVGAHYDCNYSTLATTGTMTNIATGDSTETDSDTGTATVTAAPAAAPALSVEKSVALSATGPWVDHVTVTTGTTVFFKITVTNTGNTNLTGVTLSDNTFDLVAKGCTIPTTLAVGASFDCAYSAAAAAGEHMNTATADSEESGPATDTATVTGTTPGLRVRKAVSTLASGPFINILNVAPGTTVHYRITVTNTGDVALTGVTLSDNTFDLVAKGCTIPTTLAVDASFDCNYSSVSAETTTTNVATADSNETGPETDTATVNPTEQQAAPSLNVDKTVAVSATGPWVNQVNVLSGTTVFFKITVTNTGDEALTAITLSDDKYDLVAKGCTIPTTLAIGAHFDCTYSTAAVTGTTTNTATADSEETGPDTDTATVLATTTPPPAGLTIDKTNNAPLVNVGGTNLPTANEGSTVTFTLNYIHTGSASTDGTITDVLPLGLTYVTGSATGSADFSFSGYTAGTRTLTWTASEGVSASGSVTYQAKVDAGAAGREQPLENVATIDSSDTQPDSDVSDVFVSVPPLAETDNPGVPTAPQTDIATPGATAAPGASLGFLLVVIGILAFGILFVTPMPASTRNRIRRR